jgi:chromosome segregation protein
MKLIRLHLQGFKSFKDRTTINFDEGITGIVGPNGCGKSNIVDALFWVMGEQSAKHLRGNKMKDLIFAGSSKYTPAGFAEVTLVLQNDTGKHIHIGGQVAKPAEIALTRKLYKNGDTEYRINNMPARLKDIHEVFMDTGAGAKSYSIIAQGEINRLVQAKPQERRTMIEEVAGITKFKLRKRESLKKIEYTQSNLNRLNDLQSEIYKNLKQLEKQAERAEKARRLKDRVRHHQLIVDSHKEFDFLTDYVNAKRKLISNEENLERATLTKDNLEVTLEDERNKKTDLMDKIDGLQAEYNEMAKELAASEERLKHLIDAKATKEDRIEEKNQENEDLLNDIEVREQKLIELKEKLVELQEANYAEMDFSNREEKVENLKLELQEKEEEISDLTNLLDETRSEFTEIDQLVFKNTSKLQEFSNGLEDIMAEIEEIEKNTADHSDELVGQREKASNLRESLNALEESYENIKLEKEEKTSLFNEKDQKLRSLSKEVIQLESKLQSLIDLNKSGEGVKEGGLNYIEENGTGNFEILGNIIECEPQYARSLEMLFEKDFDSLIGNSQDLADFSDLSSELSLDYIYPKSFGQLSTPETRERLSLKGINDVVAIEDIVKINNFEFREVLNKYFNGFYVAKSFDMNTALKAVAELNIKGIISEDGHLFIYKTMNGVKLSKRTDKNASMGVVQRNNLINELKVEHEEKNNELSQLESEVSELSERLEELRAQYEDVRAQKDEVKQDFIATKSSLESKEKNFSTHNSRLEILNKRKQEISINKLEILESEESNLEKKETLEQKVVELQEQLADLKESNQELKSTFESERSELLELQANAKSFHTQVESFEAQIEDANEQVRRYQEKKENNLEQLQKLEEEIQESFDLIEGLKEDNSSKAEVMSEKESYLNLIKDELTQLLSGMQEREAEVKKLTKEITDIEKSNVELNLKTEQIIIDEEILVRDCFDKYKVDLRDILKSHLELTSDSLEGLKDLSPMYVMETEEGEVEVEACEYTFDKRFPAVLRESKDKLKRYKSDLNRLGEINWQAVEDYDRQKLRYDFLRDQEAQLKKSLEDLELAIMHIDEKSKERFAEAYNEVNERFEKVFPIIFGGGEARLEIVGDLDSPECGIDIIAKPPGKKMQSINLMSGGEKAMTAVSLIFSIFLVKPSPFCLLDEVDAPLDDANVGRFNELLREMSSESQFILITHNKKTMELNDTLYGVTMQEPGVSKAVSVQLH